MIAGPAAVALSAASAGPAFANGPTISGTGSSYAAVAINQWVAEVAVKNGDSVNYQTSSSVIGLNDFAQKQVDFGASEIGYSTGQAQYTPPAGYAYQYLPDVAGATCIMYNLSGTGGQIKTLRLNSSVMLGIFTGVIKTWNDPQIQALNPGSLLPSQPITVVYRTDPSGDNYLFSNYLFVLHSQAWNAFAHQLGFQSGPNAIWPFPQGGSQGKYNFSGWIGQSGSDNASNYVASSNGTVTYVETAYALLHHMPCAAVENASGNWVQPSEYNDAVALQSDQLQPDLEQKLNGVYSSTQPSAYPISAYSYLITSEKQTNPQKGAVEGRFIMFLACTGQQSAGALGYSPLPPNLVADDFKAVSRIAGAAPPPSAPTASNCPNPYVDGTTPLPGEKQNSGGGTTTNNHHHHHYDRGDENDHTRRDHNHDHHGPTALHNRYDRADGHGQGAAREEDRRPPRAQAACEAPSGCLLRGSYHHPAVR